MAGRRDGDLCNNARRCGLRQRRANAQLYDVNSRNGISIAPPFAF